MSDAKFVEFNTAVDNPDNTGVKDVDPKEVLEKTKSVHLIDVRRPDEYTGELGHAPETELLTLDFLPEKINELPKDKTIVFICRSGGRSGKASAFALENGFKSVYNMKGGMIEWNELGLPTEGKNS